MNADLDIPEPALPPRTALFAPWRWLSRVPPVKRYSLIGALIMLAYIEAPVPLIYTMRRTGSADLPLLRDVYEPTFAPLEWCYHNSELVRDFYDGQWELIEKWIGPA